MEGQPQNPEFRINPENFHPCTDCAEVFQRIMSMFVNAHTEFFFSCDCYINSDFQSVQLCIFS